MALTFCDAAPSIAAHFGQLADVHMSASIKQFASRKREFNALHDRQVTSALAQCSSNLPGVVVADACVGCHNCAMTDRETIGQRIKRERLQRSMTQRELAESIDVGVPHVSKVEAGRENPSDSLLAKIAEVFDSDYDELLLAARRVPQDLLDRLAADPKASLQFLRRMSDPDD